MGTQAAEHFDAVVIGSGQAGNPLAMAMMKHGWKTAVIERRFPGGTCVNDGCSPSKTIDASARVAYLAKRGSDFGVETGPVTMDMHTVWERKQKIVLASRKSNGDALEGENGTLILGEASFAEDQPGSGSYRISVALQDGSGTRELQASRVFLNTGERPLPPKLDGLDAIPYLDSTSIMDLQTVPEHLVILGAGYIALEFAQMFLRFGAKVTVLERGERLVSQEDDDVAACLRGILEEDGIRILSCSNVTGVSGGAGAVTLAIEVDGKPQTIEGSHLLVATGRTPNVESLHLDRVGVQQQEHGYIKVNDRLETSAPGIWALGDVKGGPAFTHISYDDFRVLRTNLLQNGSAGITDRLLCYVMFTDPEMAHVGLSETQAAKRGITVRVAEVPMKRMARANQMAEPRGMIKALVDPETQQILGATVLGVDGGEVMTQIQIAMWGKLPYPVLRDGIFAHPTRSEVLNTLFGNFRDGAE